MEESTDLWCVKLAKLEPAERSISVVLSCKLIVFLATSRVHRLFSDIDLALIALDALFVLEHKVLKRQEISRSTYQVEAMLVDTLQLILVTLEISEKVGDFILRKRLSECLIDSLVQERQVLRVEIRILKLVLLVLSKDVAVLAEELSLGHSHNIADAHENFLHLG